MKCQKILEIKVGGKSDAPEDTWVLGGGIEMATTSYVYGAIVHKFHVRKVIKNADAKQG